MILPHASCEHFQTDGLILQGGQYIRLRRSQLFTILQGQLGPQLESRKVPLRTLIIRYGYRITTLHFSPAIETSKHREEAFDFLPKINGYPVYVRPELFPNHMVGSANDIGNTSPLTTFTNNLSWTKGAHALKFGLEFRYAHTAGYQPFFGIGLIPTATGGAGSIPVRGIDTVPGLLPSNISLANDLLLSLAGSLESVSMKFETWEPTDTEFLDYKESYNHPNNPENTRGKIRENHQNEFNFFVKDDWKVSPSLTLNLGIRWDLFRVPDFRSGTGQNWTRGPIGGNAAYFGISGRTFAEAFHSSGGERAGLTEIALIGKGTKYPEQGIWPSDKNNFSPAIGFAWSPSFGGRDLTTIRGGFQITHLLPGNSLSWIDLDLGTLPGLQYEARDTGDGTTYRDFSNLTIPLPLPLSPVEPVVIPLTDRSSSRSFYAPDYTTPYIQTFTLGITRSLPSNLLLDVRYVGTHGVKLHSTLNYNEPDFRNNGLLEALEVTRAGGDHPMFDQMLGGLDLGRGIGVVGRDVSGSEALRRHSFFRTNIANGDFRAVANTLNTTNVGTVQPAGQSIRGGTLRSSGLFPENFIVANPQFSTMQMRNNADNSIYHSMQTQLTMRPSYGVTFQATHTWSRALGITGNTPSGGGIVASYRDVLNRDADYTVLGHHRRHNFRGHGVFELPFGPGRWLGGGTSGMLARLIEGWQFGAIFNVSSGSPMNVSARTTVNATGTPDIVGAFPREGLVRWTGVFGNFFDQQYERVPDCGGIASSLTRWCTNTALADASGNIVLRNARPGEIGTLGLRPIYGPGSWDFDANIQKRFQIAESKNLTLRVDARNVFNHPTPANPNLDVNSGTFGEITTKTGSRTLAAQLRFEF